MTKKTQHEKIINAFAYSACGLGVLFLMVVVFALGNQIIRWGFTGIFEPMSVYVSYFFLLIIGIIVLAMIIVALGSESND